MSALPQKKNSMSVQKVDITHISYKISPQKLKQNFSYQGEPRWTTSGWPASKWKESNKPHSGSASQSS